MHGNRSLLFPIHCQKKIIKGVEIVRIQVILDSPSPGLCAGRRGLGEIFGLAIYTKSAQLTNKNAFQEDLIRTAGGTHLPSKIAAFGQ